MKTKRNYIESLKLSTNEFELFDNTHENIMNFFKQDEELFDSAVETGKDAYGEGGGYRENDKYVVIDKEHPFGTALYSTSDEEVVNVLKKEYYNKVEESKDIKEEKEKTLKVDLNNHEFKEGSFEDEYKNMKTMKEEKSMKITESQIQISRGSREFDSVIDTYYKKYGKHLQVDTMIYDKDSGKYYMYNDRTDYTLNTKRLNEEVESVEGIFDILGIEEENRESSKHLISQYRKLQKKFPQASIWLNGDVNVYVKGKVLEKTADLSAVEERAVEEGGHGSGNFKSGAQRHNDMLNKIFSRYKAEQERFAKFLLDNGVSKEEVEKLKQDSGLHGNPLAQKYFELKKSLKEEIVEPELPTEVTIDGELLVDDIDDIGEAYLDEVISDWLSDNYGFLHLGFDYDIVGTDVHVTNILWDTSDEDSLEENVKLNENTGNFRTNDIINLCSPYLGPEQYTDYVDELRKEEPDITDYELEERIEDIINDDYDDMYKQVKQSLEDIDEYVTVEAGYYKGFYINFRFDDGKELAENWFYYYDKDDSISELKTAVEKIKSGLKTSVEDGNLVGYGVAYRFSNGETGYHLEKDIEKTIKSIDDALNKVLDEGLKAIDEEFIDEIE